MVNIHTDFGIFLKKLRLDNREQAEDMAQKLGVSKGFLFAVQSGKKKIPESWEGKLRDVYELTPKQQKELRWTILASSDTLQINVSDVSPPKRNLAVKFVCEFRELDEEKVRGLQEILDAPKAPEQ